MSKREYAPREGEVSAADVREVLDAVTAHCDHPSEERQNDGSLYPAFMDDNLLMANWDLAMPDMSEQFPNAPLHGEPVHATARYWYGTYRDRINLWIKGLGEDTEQTYNFVADFSKRGSDDGSKRMQEEWSTAGYGHGEKIQLTENSTRGLLHTMFPTVEFVDNTFLPDVYREAVWSQIEQGAEGYTREEFGKSFSMPSKAEPHVEMSGGFHVKVEQVNRTHLQDRDAATKLTLRQYFWGVEYKGLYDGMLDRFVQIDTSPQGEIVDVQQGVEVRLMNSPYVQGKQILEVSDGPIDDGLPEALQQFKKIPARPSTETLEWFRRLAMEPIRASDIYVFDD